MNALVTNGNSRMAFCILKNLKQRGHNVFVADFIKNSLCFYSNKITTKFIYPSPFSEPNGFINELKNFIEYKNIDVLMPVGEETFLISKHQQEFKKITSLSVPGYNSILKVHNKDNLEKCLRLKEIRHPKTIKLNALKDFSSLRDAFSGQVILKPRQGGGNWGVFIPDIKSDYELQILKYLQTIKVDASRVIVQELIPVKEKFSHVVIYQNGKFIQDFADVHLRDFPISGGAGVLRRSCDPSAMTSMSKKLFDSIGWNGVAEVEYVTHAETGDFYLIEVNPRIWGGINSAISSGLDIVGMMIDIGEGKKVSPMSYSIGTQTRWFWGDIRVFPEYYRQNKSKSTVIKEYLKLFFTNTSCDEFSWDDPIPFFVWPCHALYKMLKYRTLKPVTYDSLSGEWK